MKHFCLTILFLIAGIGISSAQTTTGIPQSGTAGHAASPKLSRGPTKIDANGPADFDLGRHWVTYRNHVVVSDTQMKLTCEWLEANLPQNGTHMTNIVAETNVVMDFVDEIGQRTRAMGDKAVYYFHVQDGVTNETVTLTANPPNKPKVEQPENTMTGDAIIWDRVTDHVYVTGKFRDIYTPTNSPAGTNLGKPNIF
jgi:lipopolysaccharide export system protein LptA